MLSEMYASWDLWCHCTSVGAGQSLLWGQDNQNRDWLEPFQLTIPCIAVRTSEGLGEAHWVSVVLAAQRLLSQNCGPEESVPFSSSCRGDRALLQIGKLRHGEAACTFSDAPPETSAVPGSSACPSASHPRELHFLSSEPSSPGCLQGSAHLPVICHSPFYSVPGRFADLACSCPARPPLPHTMTLCISPGPSPPSPCVCCRCRNLAVLLPPGRGHQGLGARSAHPGLAERGRQKLGCHLRLRFSLGDLCFHNAIVII